ncbi:MAG: hypothetical protein K0U20_09855 [Proteobacteria bacterium]|nr:hypothetical protein [Pseudomonadota bacterium]
MASLKQIQNNVKTIVVFAVVKQFQKAAIIESVIQSVKANDLIATGQLASPQTSGSIIPSADDRWLVPRKSAKKIVSVRVYGSRLSSGEFFPSSIKIKINLGDYGLAPKYKDLALNAPKGPYISNYFKREQGDIIDRIEQWIEDKMDRGYSFYYTDRKGNNVPLKQGDKINTTRAAFPIMRKISKKGPDKVDFARAFNKVEATLQKASDKIEEATYFDVISPALRKSIETIF